MVDITPLIPEGRQVIQGYGDGRFRIAGTIHAGSVIVFAEQTLAWPVTTYEQITAESLRMVADRAAGLDLLIVGLGPQFRAPIASVSRDLMAIGIAVEFMDTGAACRTFNLLLGDGRPVAAALIAVD